MFYDLNVHESFLDFEEITKQGIDGCCISYAINESLKSAKPPTLPKSEACKIYSRIDVNYNTSIGQDTLSHLKAFDVVCINNVDNSNISSVIKLNPDLIRLKCDTLKHIKRSFINTLKEKQLFLELTLRDTLYGSNERIVWMNSLRRLIKLGCSRNLVISSGARYFTEIKRPHDICKLLNLFGLSDDNCRRILDNSKHILRKAALKRYSSNNAISSNIQEGDLKNDFIIGYNKNA